MSAAEPTEIVTSFPLPPKQYYSNLTEEKILSMVPPPFPSQIEDHLNIFGSSQSLSIKDKESLMVDDALIGELKEAKREIFANFKRLLDEIELVQDTTKMNELLALIDQPFKKAFDITEKLSIIQSAISLNEFVEKELKEVEDFLKETSE